MFLAVVYLYIINIFFFTNNIRYKFFYFIINISIIMCVGFYYNLDGMVMLFFISELSIILIFITMFSQLYVYKKLNPKYNKFGLLIPILLIILNFSYYDAKLITFTNFYQTTVIVLNDFYYIYNCYFEKQILITLFTTILITLYSIFFILLYFTLKNKANLDQKKKKNINLLRKQNLLHQNNYNTQIKIFKNKN